MHYSLKALITGGLLMMPVVGRGAGYQDEQMAFEPILNAPSPMVETMLRAGYEWGHMLCPHADVRIRSVVMARPDWVGAQASLLVCDASQGRLVDEIQDLTRLLAIAPENWGWWVQRANLYATYFYFDKAIADVSQAIVLRPRSGDLYRLRSMWKGRIGDRAGEFEDLKQLHELSPALGSVWLEMAELAPQAGKADAEELHYRQMVEINPPVLPEKERDDSKLSMAGMSRDELMLRAGYAQRVKRTDLALHFVNAVLKVEPSYIPALELRYRIERVRSGFPRAKSPAMDDLTLLVELSPAAWLEEMLQAAMASGDEDLAMQCVTEMIVLEPYDSNLLVTRAAMKQRKKLVDAAIEDYKRAISLAPGSTVGYVAMADIYDDRKDYAREIRMLELALIGDQDNVTWKRKLAVLRGDCWPCDTIH